MAKNSIPQSSGVYKIICTANGKIYVGSTVNLHKRWNEHQSGLRSGTHRNPHLQNAWNEYGENAFTFEVVELVMPWSRLDRENYWLKTLKPTDRKIGFNVGLAAENGMTGRKHSPETRAKISAIHKGRKPTDATRAKMSANHVGKKHNPNTYTAEVRAKMSAAKKGKKLSSEHIEKLKIAHIGFRHTPESRAKMSEKQWRQYTYVVIAPDGTETIVGNLTQISKQHGLNSGHMRSVARGERKHHKGWKVRRIS